MKESKVVSEKEWLVARKQLLQKEKELTRQRDQLNAERRELPWMKITKPYFFEGPSGKQSLADLFEGRSQLIIKHFMFEPGRKEPCIGCSFEVDNAEGALVHLEHHDVTYVAVSRAPFVEIEIVKKRMNWRFKWVSSFDSDFNYDFGVSFTKEQLAKGDVFYNYEWRHAEGEEASGLSIFYKDEHGNIYHTYSSYGRGSEEVLATYMLLDLTPKGRNENGPHHDLRDWVRLHNQYGDTSASQPAHCH